MRTTSTPMQRAAVVAGSQFGVIAYRQALAAGLSDHQVRALVLRGVWRRAVRGVFVVAGAPDTAQQRAMVAYLATQRGDGVVSYTTAAAAFGLLPWSPHPHVSIARGRSPRAGIAKIHREEVLAVDRQWSDGMLMTSVSRTICDVARMVDGPSLEGVLDDALCSKVAAVSSIEAAMARLPRNRAGKAQLRQALAVWSERIRPGSVAEVRLLRALEELGLIGVVSQHEVFDAHRGFVARLDLATPERRRGFEYDGVLPHSPRHWERDEPRYRRLRELGWEVDTVTKIDLLPGEPRLRRLVERWLAA